jgi:hypothetical protein
MTRFGLFLFGIVAVSVLLIGAVLLQGYVSWFDALAVFLIGVTVRLNLGADSGSGVPA